MQLHAGFSFTDAAGVSGYLSELGVSHLYLSPVLQAAMGSTHGYDVVDPTRLNDELGGDAGWARLAAALGEAGLGRLLDIVPNHMAITGRDNAWWWDVLENGPASVYASYFDVDWRSSESKLTDIVLLPVLGDHYGRELEAGRLQLAREAGSFVVTYYDKAFPVAPRSLDTLLDAAAGRTSGDRRQELESISTAFGRLPLATSTDTGSVRERHRDKEILRSRLAELVDRHRELAEALDAEAAAVNGDADRLAALLARQNYRLAWWRTAGEELDYRRFFDINDLVGLRVEDPSVFDATHALVIDMLATGAVDGVRIDHVDGLRDPAGYLARLEAATPGAWMVVEKILEAGEELRSGWPVAGTTGYDWLATVGALLVDPAGYEELLQGYLAFAGPEAVAGRPGDSVMAGAGPDGAAGDVEATSWSDIVHRSKHEVLAGPLSADLTRLVARLAAICERHRRYRDYTRRDLRETLSEVIAGFDVYRSYVRIGQPADDADRASVARAVAAAAARRPDLDGELVDFLRDILLGEIPGADEAELAVRFAQLTGPVMAKAVEDTAFYRWLPLSSANEVGGDPGRPTLDPASYHERCGRLHHLHPDGLLALSTHDTKRSEDVRARIAVLAEIPREWLDAVGRWKKLSDRHRDRSTRLAAPDTVTEWLAYQSLVGAWPLDADRLGAYLGKATREAKVHTSWTDPVPAFDDAVQAWARALLEDGDFVADVSAFVDRVRHAGWSNSLAQKLLTLTGPGVPDIYQGSELWDYSLVDPDNRRPVDYDRRRSLLRGADGQDAASAWRHEDGDGFTKLLVVRAALGLRRARPEWFGPGPAGAYRPMIAGGRRAAHAVAARRGMAITVATRLPIGLERAGGWDDTAVALPPGQWRDHLGGRTWEGGVGLADLLADLPVALLAPADNPK
ncbi:MAG: malto-oligosyltrehalose synthase [Acidimicrobiales bacterium]